MRRTLLAVLFVALCVGCTKESPFDVNGLKPGVSVSTFKKTAAQAGLIDVDKSNGSSYIYYAGTFMNTTVEIAGMSKDNKIVSVYAYKDFYNFDDAHKLYSDWATYAIQKYPDIKGDIAMTSPAVTFSDKETSTRLTVKMNEFAIPYRVLYMIEQTEK